MTKYVYNKNSFENAVEVSNYPWGFRLKTKRRTWIETDKNKGDRVCFRTLNPKTNKWCAVNRINNLTFNLSFFFLSLFSFF